MIFVTCNDKFMSGWGLARGKINKLIFVCEDLKQARIVKSNLENRSEMKYINICFKKPYYNKNKFYIQEKTIKKYPNYYIKHE